MSRLSTLRDKIMANLTQTRAQLLPSAQPQLTVAITLGTSKEVGHF